MRMHLYFFSLVPGARTLIFHLDIVIADILYDQAGLNSDFTQAGSLCCERSSIWAVKALISSIPFRKVVVVLNTGEPEEL